MFVCPRWRQPLFTSLLRDTLPPQFSPISPNTSWLGVVVWAIFSQTEPYWDMAVDEVLASITADPTARHTIPPWTDPVAAGVIELCWATDPSTRPPFDHTFDVLRDRYCGDDVGGSPGDVYAEGAGD